MNPPSFHYGATSRGLPKRFMVIRRVKALLHLPPLHEPDRGVRRPAAALKGPNSLAQGTALGNGFNQRPRLKALNKEVVQGLQPWNSFAMPTQGVALR